MTVAELIEKLKEFPADAEVWLVIGWDVAEIEEVGRTKEETGVYIRGW